MVFQTTRIATSAFLRATLLGSTFIVSSASLMATAAAQNVETGVVSGKVTDAVSGINLQGVLVRIPSLNLRESTDREGTFRFGRVPVGTHEVIITYQNRQSETRTVTVTSNQTEVITLALQDLGATDDEIIVRGTRPIADSEAAAYSRQKSSDKLINVVAADTIGRFPDQNVAAALSRLPGISVERDQGQERYVNLRGAPNKWTTISFNGLNVVSPEGRASRFDTIPNAIVSSIEATKAVTADMPAESIAGNINIITRNPFDRPGLHTSGEAALGFLQLGGGEQSNLAGTISNTFADDTMGFLISGTFYRRNQVTDNIENRFEFAGEADGTPGEDLIWSRGTDIRVYNLVRANKGLTGRFDWRPNENHELFVSSIFTEFTDDENRDQYIFDYDSDAPNGCYAQVEAPCNNTPTAGIVYGVDIDATFNTNNYRENIFTNTIGGDHFVSGWDLGWRLNATHTEDEFFAPARYLFNAPGDVTERPSVAYDYTDPDFPETLLFDTIDNGDGTYSLGERRFDISSNDLGLTRIERIDRMERTQAYTAKFDAQRELEFAGKPVTFKTGVQFDHRIKKGDRTDTQVTPASIMAAGLTVPSLADIQKNEDWPGDFEVDFRSSLYQADGAVELYNDLALGGASFIQTDESEESFYRVEETIISAYAMGTFDFDWGNLVAGLRVEASENEGQALALGLNTPETVNGYTLVSAGDDRIDFFPSLHVNYDLTESKKIRISFNSGLARADFDERAPNFNINDTNGEESISGGNPFVEPEKTYGVDVYYEHYLEPLGIFSVGAFYKDIQDPLINLNTIFGSTQFDEQVPGGETLLRSTYEFDTIGNGNGGYYTGIEISYAQQFVFLPDFGLPEWTDGFGFNGNVTLVDSEVELADGRKAPLEGASELTYNTSVYWEKYGLSLRTNWQWRTDWINSYGSSEEFDRYWSQLGRLSFGARYQVNDNLEWFFDANNLTDQLGRRIRENRGRVYEVEGFGERYLTGIRFNF